MAYPAVWTACDKNMLLARCAGWRNSAADAAEQPVDAGDRENSDQNSQPANLFWQSNLGPYHPAGIEEIDQWTEPKEQAKDFDESHHCIAVNAAGNFFTGYLICFAAI